MNGTVYRSGSCHVTCNEYSSEHALRIAPEESIVLHREDAGELDDETMGAQQLEENINDLAGPLW